MGNDLIFMQDGCSIVHVLVNNVKEGRGTVYFVIAIETQNTLNDEIIH